MGIWFSKDDEFLRELDFFLFERFNSESDYGLDSEETKSLDSAIKNRLMSAIEDGIIPPKIKTNVMKRVCDKEYLTIDDYWYADECYWLIRDRLKENGEEWCR